MTSAAELRAQLQASTGVDFAGYADAEFVDTITGWSGLWAIVKEAAVSLAVGVAVAAVAIVAASTSGAESDASTGMVISGVVGGLGVALAVFALRLRRRIPTEVDRVFEVSARLADRVAADIAAGDLQVSASDAARGIVVVAAVPALVRVTERRLPVLGMVLGPVAGSMVSRVLLRVWPSGKLALTLDRFGSATDRLHATLSAARDAIVPRLGRAVRWATLPLLLAGGALVVVAVAVLLLSLAVG